jgi:hypothetical protein
MMLETSLDNLLSEIEDLINHNHTQSLRMENSSNWLMFRSSLDVIDDTQLAIEAFRKDELGDSLIDGFGYLQIYGLLQSLFLQQDALKNISKSLDINIELTPELMNIRKLRNDTTGHPTDRNRGEYFCFIVRSSISDSSFTYYKDRPEGDRFNEVHVDIAKLIQIQQDETSDILREVIEKLRQIEQQHKDQFKGVKMIETFPNELNWYFSKLNEAISNSKLNDTGALFVSKIRAILPRIKREIANRGILKSGDWYQGLSSEVDYPLIQLDLFFNSSENCEINEKIASIFVFFLRIKFDEMKSIAQKIDEEYSTPG